MSLKWIIVAILGLPVAELALFVIVVAQIGFLRAFVLQLAISAAGLLVLRHAGSARLSRLRDQVAAEGPTGWRLPGSKGILVIAGILLVLPGFITDVLGVALLVPPLRRWFGALTRNAIDRRRRSVAHPDPVIDLAPSEWRDVTKPTSAKRRRRASRR